MLPRVSASCSLTGIPAVACQFLAEDNITQEWTGAILWWGSCLRLRPTILRSVGWPFCRLAPPVKTPFRSRNMEPLTPTDCEALVAQLAEPTTRRSARGNSSPPRRSSPCWPVSTPETRRLFGPPSSRWANCAPVEAVEPLCRLLDREVLLADVCEALGRITGQDFGRDAKRWRRGVAAQAPVHDLPQAKGIAACVQEAGKRLGIEPTASGKSFWFKVPLPDGRAHDVAVQTGHSEAQDDELALVYTECGRAEAKHFEALLRKNLTLRAGAFAIWDIDGHAHFVMIDTLSATATAADDLARRIEQIAAQAGAVEGVLAREEQSRHASTGRQHRSRGHGAAGPAHLRARPGLGGRPGRTGRGRRHHPPPPRGPPPHLRPRPAHPPPDGHRQAQPGDGLRRGNPRHRLRGRSPTRPRWCPKGGRKSPPRAGWTSRGQRDRVAQAVDRLRQAGISVSLFLDPDPRQIEAAARLAVDAVELHTGQYALAAPGAAQAEELENLKQVGAAGASSAGMTLHAGHGLTYRNVRPIAAIEGMHELNIGHSIVARAIMVGFEEAVREMKRLISGKWPANSVVSLTHWRLTTSH